MRRMDVKDDRDDDRPIWPIILNMTAEVLAYGLCVGAMFAVRALMAL